KGLRAGGRPCELERLRDAVRQLSAGVHALHERGRVHRDLKPSNVRLTPAGRVVILDFGLVNEIHRRTSTISSLGAAGTPMYMAPEQAAGQLATPASDWYAVGVMLFAAVTGALPFASQGLKVMLDKQIQDPPAPASLGAELPPELDRLIQALLARDPAQRPSAHELIAWCDGRLQLFKRRHPTPPPPLAKARLVGLERQQEALEEAFHRVTRERRPVVVDLFGPSGTGKTALLGGFLADLRRREATVVIEGRCFAQETVDYKAFDGLIDGLANYLRRLPAEVLTALVDDSFDAAARVFPVLGRVREVMAAPAGPGLDAALGVDAVRAEVMRRLNLGGAGAVDPQAARARGFRGLKLLLYRLALRTRLVLCVDDLQWGDLDSAQLFAELWAQPSPPPLLFIAAWRSEDAASSPLLQALAGLRTGAGGALATVAIATGPLAADEAAQLAYARMGGAGGRDEAAAQGMARLIARESAGNPMLIEALCLHVDPEADPATLRSTLGGRAASLEQLIGRRLRTLPPEARRALELVALAGQPLAREALARALGLADELRPVLGPLVAGRLIRTTTDPRGSVEIYHDRIRVAVLRGLALHEQAERHRSLAAALRASGCDDAERLARHLFAVGERAEAAEFAADAAYLAEASAAFERAAMLYRLAIACRPQDWVLRRKAGDALVLAGRNAEAGPLLLAAAEQAPAGAAARIRRAAAESFLTCGQLATGLEILRPLLAELGVAYPESEAAAIGLARAEFAALAARGTEFVERSEPELASRDKLRLDACWCAGKGLLAADPARGAYYVLRSAQLALAAGEAQRIVRSLALAATIAANWQRPEERAWIAAAERLALKMRDPGAQAVVAVHVGAIHRCHGAWLEAFEALEEGLQQLRERCPAATWERTFAAPSLLLALEALGEVRKLAGECERLAQQAHELGDLHVGTIAGLCGAAVWLARDDVAKARARVAAALQGWPAGASQVHRLHALRYQVDCDLYVGDPAAAWRRVTEAWPGLTDSAAAQVAV
ncbi:MAG: serine/threonine-protein kinase PknK, partial [Myxococcales bacterium]|nr:serine/threonine-protein kinase PknK [Myxococcales bacterium]